MKRNQVRIHIVKEKRGFVPGDATIIGKRPKHRPYVNLHDDKGDLIASIDDRDMNRLVKKWREAWGDTL